MASVWRLMGWEFPAHKLGRLMAEEKQPSQSDAAACDGENTTSWV